MNSSQYEKALLVGLAYVIGFTTAFIAFNNSQSINVSDQVFENTSIVSAKKSTSDKVELVDNELGLFIKDGDRERVISADRSFAYSDDEASERVGFHYRVFDAQVSPDNRFVYYCEQLTVKADDCVPLVFDITNDISHKVKIESASDRVSLDWHEANWTPDNKLSLNHFVSSSSDEPWR